MDSTTANQPVQCTAPTATARNTTRPTKPRATSYFNSFQTSCSTSTDAPPAYAVAARAKPTLTRSLSHGDEPLPQYSCSVSFEGKMLLKLESVNPLAPAGQGEWGEVYIILRGTFLAVHRLKNSGPGRRIRTYSLQHAEVGLATDSQHLVLIPQTRLAHLIPTAARRRAWQKDAALFKPSHQTILRLRVECDQILLADDDEERIHSLVNSFSAAIDISHSLDERSIPRQCTVPRRRRRPIRPQFTGDLTDPTLIAEQERIMRQMYPGLRGIVEDQAQEDVRPTVEQNASSPGDAPRTPAREEEEIDFSMMREESAGSEGSERPTRPSATRQTTSTTVQTMFTDDMMYATPNSYFDDAGKWQPAHNRTPAQIQRYVKRCMPVLPANASRASDIIYFHGRRMRINWRMELLEEWELQPPSYKSHKFDSSELGRANSQRSTTASAKQALRPSSGSIIASDDDAIAHVEQGLESLQLSKSMSATVKNTQAASIDPKGHRTVESMGQESQGIVFCF